MNLAKSLPILILVLVLGTNTTSAAPIGCGESLAVSTSLRSYNFVPDRDISRVDAILSEKSTAEHAAASEVAEALLSQDLKFKHKKWLESAGHHAVLTVAYFSYLVASLYIGESVITDLRNAGVINFATLHYSNFAEGIGFVGFTHHGLSSGVALTKNMTEVLNSKGFMLALNSTKAKIRTALGLKDFPNPSLQSYHNKAFVLTGLIFTVFNIIFELNKIIPQPIIKAFNDQNLLFAKTNLDWTDFLAGQVGLVVYYLISKKLDRLTAPMEK